MADTNDIMNSLMGILGNEEAKGKIMDAISSLNTESNTQEDALGGSNAAQPSSDAFLPQLGNDNSMDMIFRMKNMLDRFNNISDNRIGLLNAIRPYMRSGKAHNIDIAINFIKILNFSNSFRSQERF